ncbi:MAG: phage tail tube protein [Syntrophales bacterium]|nr:phage tail tube protein [Syntrophales bacterium]
MTIANAVNKKVVIAKQSAQGTIAAVDAATAQYLRFLSFNQDQTNEQYTSNEMRPDKQVGDVNIGPQDGNGACNGELTPGTYEMFEAAILRKVFVAGSSDAANSGVAAAATTGAAGTFTRDDVDGSWITDGFKLGDVVQQTGWTTTATANNSHNFLITALTPTVMTVLGIDGTPPATKVKGDEVTTTVVGQKCWVPAASHTEDWFTIEHYFSDVDLSEVFWDCKVSSMAVKVPASGIPTIDFNILGLQMTEKGTGAAPYFTGPAAITTTEVVHSGKAVIMVSGVEQTLATGIDFEIVGSNQTMGAVIGTNVKPGISDGRVEVKGNLSIYYEDDTLSGYFRAGTEVSIFVVLPVSDDANADFIAFTLPVVKLTGAAKSGDKEITHSIPFMAKYNSSGDDGTTCTENTLATTISMQDGTLT